MRALVRGSVLVAALIPLAGCGGDDGAASKSAAKSGAVASATPDASDLNREATAPPIVYVYKTQGDDPMPWTLTVRKDATANLIYGGGHTGGNDQVVLLGDKVTRRAARLTAAVPWERVRGHTVEPGGFGGDDNMARYVLRRGKITTVYAAGDMPASVSRLVGLLDKIIDGDVGKVVAADTHHSSNGGVLTDP
jgi:hypothetical protein